MSQVTTYGWTIEEDFARYSAHGYQGVELWLNKVARNGAPYDRVPSEPLGEKAAVDVLALLAASGLEATGVVCAGLFTEPDRDARRARVEHLRSTVRFAAKVGASGVLVVPGNLNGSSRRAAVETSAAAISEALPEATALGVDLAIEPLRAVHTDFVNTIPEAMEIVELVSDDRCGLCLDTFQLWRGEAELDALLGELRSAAPWARVVQVADSAPVPRSIEDRKIPGEGSLPLAEMLATLFEEGYDGWLSVEIMSRELWAGDREALLARCAAGMGRVLSAARGAVRDPGRVASTPAPRRDGDGDRR